MAQALTSEPVTRAAQLLRGRRIAVLTGAGISTDSGIPAYRGAGARIRRPMTIRTFLADEAARRRYWLGGHLGWSRFSAAVPNGGHLALARLESAGVVTGIVTQNVDALHLQAGSGTVVELHGSVHRVRCLECGQMFDRHAIAAQINEANPWIHRPGAAELGPDGDVTPESTEGFIVPVCSSCGGMLKPDLVFFGEYVPADRFRAAESLVRASDALLVAGTSLVVNSGIRIVERARRRRLPIVIINQEPTKADARADLVIPDGTTPVLTALAALLSPSDAVSP